MMTERMAVAELASMFCRPIFPKMATSAAVTADSNAYTSHNGNADLSFLIKIKSLINAPDSFIIV